MNEIDREIVKFITDNGAHLRESLFIRALQQHTRCTSRLRLKITISI